MSVEVSVDTENLTDNGAAEYPYIGQTDCGALVCFIAPKTGFMFTVGSSWNKPLTFKKFWGEELFTRVKGKFTLTIECD